MPTLSTIGAACARAWGFTSGLVKDQYFNLVSLLLPGNGTNGAQNNTFLDSGTANSGSGFTITRNGNTTQGTFSPFSQTGWGGNFNGTSFIQAPDNATMQVGTSDFTIEMWAYFTSDFSGSKWLGGKGDQSTAAGTAFSFYSSAFEVYSGSTSYSLTCPTWSSNRWYHIAIVKSGTSTNNLKLYIDGSVQSQASIGSNSVNSASGNGLKIGAYSSAGVASYISNFRFVKGRAVYTSAFTPPTSPLGVTSGGQNPPQGTETSLLVLQSNRFVDVANNYTLTLSSNPSVTPFSPFAPTSSYSAAAVGGSGYFDGSGDYLSVADNVALQFGTGDFCFETWVYPLSFPSTNNGFACKGTNNAGTFDLSIRNTGKIEFYTTVFVLSSSATVTVGQWTHIALTRSGTDLRLFVNGNLDTTVSSFSTNFNNAGTFYAGSFGNGTQNYFNGYLSGYRMVKGSPVYTAAFTPPTAPLTNITNTSLLLNFTNAGVVDATAKNVLETVGNAQISNGAGGGKWGGGSVYFDGLNSYLLGASSQQYEFGSGDFTIEAWLNISAAPGDGGIITKGLTGTIDTKIWSLEFVGSGTYPNAVGWYVNAASASFIITGTTNLKSSTWTHVAVCKSGNNTRLFVNGQQEGSTYTTNYTIASGGSLYVGTSFYAPTTRDITGYIDDLRITKFARYTANFPAPTAPFPLQ